MKKEEEPDIFVVHTERITISGGRYLIFYTFTSRSDASSVDSKEAQANELESGNV